MSGRVRWWASERRSKPKKLKLRKIWSLIAITMESGGFGRGWVSRCVCKRWSRDMVTGVFYWGVLSLARGRIYSMRRVVVLEVRKDGFYRLVCNRFQWYRVDLM